jgi:hypothetical protein
VIDVGEAKAKRELSEFYKDVLTPVLAPNIAAVETATKTVVREGESTRKATIDRIAEAEDRTKRKIDAVAKALSIPIEPPDEDSEPSAGAVLFELNCATELASRRLHEIVELLRVPPGPSTTALSELAAPGQVLRDVNETVTELRTRLAELQPASLANRLVSETAVAMKAPDSPLRELLVEQFKDVGDRLNNLNARVSELDSRIVTVDAALQQVMRAKPALESLKSLREKADEQKLALDGLTLRLVAIKNDNDQSRDLLATQQRVRHSELRISIVALAAGLLLVFVMLVYFVNSLR